MSLSAPQFLADLASSGILSPDRYQTVEQSLSPIERVNPPQGLAQRLARDGVISPYQGEVLLAGMGAHLKHGDLGSFS